jgi:hypothetical protein
LSNTAYAGTGSIAIKNSPFFSGAGGRHGFSGRFSKLGIFQKAESPARSPPHDKKHACF